jgi:flagellin-like hook-associated protein FlgL
VSAGSAIESLLGQMQQAAQIAADPNLTSTQLSQLDAGFKAGLAQIQQAISGATVDGSNLIDGSGAPPASGASLTAFNLSLGGPLIGVDADASLSDPSGSANLADELGQALANVTQVVGQIAAEGQSIQGHLTVLAQATGALAPGVSSQINPDLDGDGARLQALQVQQTLAGSNSAISNQSPQSILALFAA